jgi:hypothetical protein
MRHDSAVHPASYQRDTCLFPRRQNGQGVKLTTHLHPVLTLRMYATLPHSSKHLHGIVLNDERDKFALIFLRYSVQHYREKESCGCKIYLRPCWLIVKPSPRPPCPSGPQVGPSRGSHCLFPSSTKNMKSGHKLISSFCLSLWLRI